MYFKPRIFISSTIGDKLEVRRKIKRIFEVAGAEVTLYEKDLTPSIDRNTYRTDILQTDFVVFIIDERYGHKTDTGISGTEEEFNIITYSKKSCHVYLKEIEKTDEAKRFESLINSLGISYYYYKNHTDLMRKLKSTFFTIARDIVFYKMDSLQVDPILLKRIAIKHDIKEGKKFCKLMDRAIDINLNTPFSFIQSNLFIAAIDIPATYIKNCMQSIFIDKYCENMLRNLCDLITNFTSAMSLQSCPNSNLYPIDFLGQTIYLANNQWLDNVDFSWYDGQLKIILDSYNAYRNYLAQKSLEAELYTD